MNGIIVFFAFIGFLAVIILALLLIGNYKRIKQDTKGDYREFTDILELLKFIRTVFECKIEHKVIMYGFVDSVFQDDTLFKTGILDEKVIDVDVFLVTPKDNLKVNTLCGDFNANLTKGDFVAVLPLYNERHKSWSYILIAKLEKVYLGKNRGFLVKEKYID